MARPALLNMMMIAGILFLLAEAVVAAAAGVDFIGAAPPKSLLPPPRSRAPGPIRVPSPLPSPRLGAPAQLRALPPKPMPVPLPPPQLGALPPKSLIPPPRLGAPAPIPKPSPPPRLGAPPRLAAPPPPTHLPSPPAHPPQLGVPRPKPLPSPPYRPPQMGAPSPTPLPSPPRLGTPLPTPLPSPIVRPPRLGVPLPTPLPSPPRRPPRVGAPSPTPLPPRPIPPPRLGSPLPTPLPSPPLPPPWLRAPSRTPLPSRPLPPPRLGAPSRSAAPSPTPMPSPLLPPPRLGAPTQMGAQPPIPMPSPPLPVVAPGGPKVPALIAFGDSIVDTGNNNYFLTVVRANFPPYGKDFPSHKATGRFSDGRITVDFLASALGIKEMLPPYLNKSLTLEDLKTGVSFASAASGYDNATCRTSSTLTMERQLQLFAQYKAKVGTIPDGALYIVVSGSNDVVQHFNWADGMTEPEYADFMTQRAATFIEALIAQGARQIGVAGAPPVGCIPSQRRIAGGVKLQCATDRNQLALMFNRKLSVELSRMAGRFRDVNIFYVDLYSILSDVVTRADALGFKNGKDACCGFVGLAAGPLCNMASRLCENPSQYVFWDSYHPTERAYKIMIDDFMNRYSRYIH